MSETIEKSIWIDAQMETVFEYFTDPEKMTEWCGLSANLDPRPGGIYELNMGQAGVFKGRFVTVTKPSKIIYEVDPPPGMEMEPSRVEINLTSDLNGTRVSMKHSGLPGPFIIPARRGWDYHSGRLTLAACGKKNGPDLLCEQPLEGAFE